MKKIALLACSKSKKDQPEVLFRAEDIYTGNSFRKSLNKVKKEDFDDYFIISAKHHLLKKDQMISYYDKTLHKMSAKECKEWADIVIQQLKELFNNNLDDIEFHIFGGKKYYENLYVHLKCCVVYEYKNSNSINLNQYYYYEYGKILIQPQHPFPASYLRKKEVLEKITNKPGYYK